MRLRFLGTGTSTGNPEIGCHCEVCTSTDSKDQRWRSSALLEVKGKFILIDCGPDFRMQILEAMKTWDIPRLDAVLITHEHYDHIGGLDELRSFCKNGAVDVYAEELVVKATKKRMEYAFAEKKYPGIPLLNLHTIDPTQAFEVKGIRIEPVRILHGNLPILGFRIGKLAYITDMKQIPEKEYTKLQNLNTLIINALRPQDHFSHQTIEEALQQAEKIKAQKNYFIHMNHHFGLHQVMQKRFPENILLSYDGLELTIED